VLLGLVISAMSSATFAMQISVSGSAYSSDPNFLTVDKTITNISNESLNLLSSGRLQLGNTNTFEIDKFKSNENTYLNPITLNVCPNQPINLVVYNSRGYLHMDFSSIQGEGIDNSRTVNENDYSELYLSCKGNALYYVRLDNGGASYPTSTSASLHVSRVDGLPGSLSYVSKLDTTYQEISMSISTDDSTFYVYHDKGVTRYDLNNGQLSNPHELTSDNACPMDNGIGFKITSDHKYLYSPCHENGKTGIMASSVNEDGSIKNKYFSPVGYAGAYSITPNGKYLYSTPSQGIQYYNIIRSVILSYEGLTFDPNFSYGIVITPDGKRLYYSNYDMDGNQWINWYTINSDGSLTYISHQGIDCDQRTRGFAISHSGRYMYIVDWSSITFYDINSDGSLTKFGQIVVGAKLDNIIISNDDKYLYTSVNGIIYTYKVYGIDTDFVSNNKSTPSPKSLLTNTPPIKPINQSAILPWGRSSPNLLQKLKVFSSKWLHN